MGNSTIRALGEIGLTDKEQGMAIEEAADAVLRTSAMLKHLKTSATLLRTREPKLETST